MTEKEERNFEQKMFDIISTQGAAAAAINCMEIAKDYALCKQVKKLNIDDVSNNVVSFFCACTVPSLNYGLTADFKCNKCNRPLK